MAGYKIPTQADFNAAHQYPIDYGEDGHCAVANTFTQAEAFEKFKEYFNDNQGEVPDWLKIEDVRLMDFGYGVNPDYANEPNEEDRMGYILLYGETDRKARFTGWVLNV